MNRVLAVAAAVVAGLVVGAVAALAFGQSRAPVPALPPTPAPPPTETALTAPKPAPAPEPPERLLLAWTAGGLPHGFAERVASVPRAEAVTMVRGGLVELAASWDADGQAGDELDDGWVVPLDAIAFDPSTYASFVPKSAAVAVGELADGQALLGETAALLRGLGEGGSLELADGTILEVAGVVDDAVIAGAEIAMTAGTAGSGPAGVPRYVLLAYQGDRAEVEAAIRAVEPGTAVRLRGPGESPILRHGDAVLTQAEIKKRFGEFSYRRGQGRRLEQDPGWAAAHLVTRDVPILGAVRCHRAVVDALAGALAELEREHLAATVDPDGYAGCHESRLTSSLDTVSRHAWGVAFDLNVPDNPPGRASTQDPRLVEVMQRWGFAWGGEWLVPDPAHFEYLRPPAP